MHEQYHNHQNPLSALCSSTHVQNTSHGKLNIAEEGKWSSSKPLPLGTTSKAYFITISQINPYQANVGGLWDFGMLTSMSRASSNLKHTSTGLYWWLHIHQAAEVCWVSLGAQWKLMGALEGKSRQIKGIEENSIHVQKSSIGEQSIT